MKLLINEKKIKQINKTQNKMMIFRQKPDLVDSKLDSQSKGFGFESCLILH